MVKFERVLHSTAVLAIFLVTGIATTACSDVPSNRTIGPSPAGQLSTAEARAPNSGDPISRLPRRLIAPKAVVRGSTPAYARVLERLAQPREETSVAELRARNRMSWYGGAYIVSLSKNMRMLRQSEKGKLLNYCQRLESSISELDMSGASIRQRLLTEGAFADLCRNGPRSDSRPRWHNTMANMMTLDDSVEVTQDGLDLAVAVEGEVDAATSQGDLMNRLDAVMDEVDLLPEGDQMIVGAAVSVALEGWIEAFDDANWPPSSGGGGGGGEYEGCIEQALLDGMSEEEAWNACNAESSEVSFEGATRRRPLILISAVNASSSTQGFCDTYVRPFLRKNAAKVFIGSFLGGGAVGAIGGGVAGIAKGMKARAVVSLALWAGAGSAAVTGGLAIGAALVVYYNCEYVHGTA